jgi:hypothetical protein
MNRIPYTPRAVRYSQPPGTVGLAIDRIPEVRTIMVPECLSQAQRNLGVRYLCAYALATSAQMQLFASDYFRCSKLFSPGGVGRTVGASNAIGPVHVYT